MVRSDHSSEQCDVSSIGQLCFESAGTSFFYFFFLFFISGIENRFNFLSDFIQLKWRKHAHGFNFEDTLFLRLFIKRSDFIAKTFYRLHCLVFINTNRHKAVVNWNDNKTGTLTFEQCRTLLRSCYADGPLQTLAGDTGALGSAEDGRFG